eukprot:10121966-Alexandrium_andersonii.AAC.1
MSPSNSTPTTRPPTATPMGVWADSRCVQVSLSCSAASHLSKVRVQHPSPGMGGAAGTFTESVENRQRRTAPASRTSLTVHCPVAQRSTLWRGTPAARTNTPVVLLFGRIRMLGTEHRVLQGDQAAVLPELAEGVR